MIDGCFLIKILNKDCETLFKEFILSVDDKAVFEKRNDYIVIYSSSDIYYVLFNSYSFLVSDIGSPFVILYTHKINEIALFCLSKLLESRLFGVYRLFNAVIKLSIANNIVNDLVKKEFAGIDKEILDVAKMYIAADLNVVRTSELMHAHRNTIYYRLNKFISITNLDIKYPYNAAYFAFFCSIN